MSNGLVQDLGALKKLPNTWNVSPFEEVIKDSSGGNKKTLKSDFLDSGEFVIVDQGQEKIAGYTNNKDLLVKVPPPYVVFGDHTRIFKYIDVPFAMGADGTKVLKPKDVTILAEKYLYYFFLTLNIPNTGYNRHYKYLKDTKIPLPPLPEQKKIASILDAADNLRQKDQQLIEKYTALSQSLFLEMFGDPVSNPMGWDKKHLKEVGIVRTGNTPSREIVEYYGTHIEWIKTNNINTPSIYLTSAEEYLSEAGLKVGRCVNAGSILVTCIAGSKSVIGNVAIADRKVAFNQQINSFTPFEANVLFFYSLFKAGKKHIQSFSTDSMKGMINKSKFESIDFIIPPLELQNQFAERIQSIEAQKHLALASLEKSEALFNSLLQRAFKGELTT